MSDTGTIYGPIEVDVTVPWPDHIAVINGNYGVTCRCGGVLAWPLGWAKNDHSAGRLVAYHADAILRAAPTAEEMS